VQHHTKSVQFNGSKQMCLTLVTPQPHTRHHPQPVPMTLMHPAIPTTSLHIIISGYSYTWLYCKCLPTKFCMQFSDPLSGHFNSLP